MTLRDLLRADWHAVAGGRRAGPFVFPRFAAVLLHRLAHACASVPPLAAALAALNQALTGADIHPKASIGPGWNIEHTGGLVVGKVTAGARLTTWSGVTLGSVGRHQPGFPTIGDDVLIGTKASVLGPVRVGDCARIGAHALVLTDIPAGGRVRA